MATYFWLLVSRFHSQQYDYCAWKKGWKTILFPLYLEAVVNALHILVLPGFRSYVSPSRLQSFAVGVSLLIACIITLIDIKVSIEFGSIMMNGKDLGISDRLLSDVSWFSGHELSSLPTRKTQVRFLSRTCRVVALTSPPPPPMVSTKVWLKQTLIRPISMTFLEKRPSYSLLTCTLFR